MSNPPFVISSTLGQSLVVVASDPDEPTLSAFDSDASALLLAEVSAVVVTFEFEVGTAELADSSLEAKVVLGAVGTVEAVVAADGVVAVDAAVPDEVPGSALESLGGVGLLVPQACKLEQVAAVTSHAAKGVDLGQ